MQPSGSPREWGPTFLIWSAAAIAELASAGPMAAEIANYKSTYAGYALAGSVNTTYGDSEVVDEAQIQEIVDTYFPQVWDEATLWVSRGDRWRMP
jgi:hypothetical protein